MVLPRVHQVTSPKARAILADFLLGFISPKKIGFWIVWKRCFHLCYIVSTDILTKVSSLRKQEWRILLCNYFVISATNVCPASLPVNVVSRRRTWERTRAIDFLTLTKVESTRKWKWNRGCRRFGQEVEERLRSCLGGVTWRWPILTSDTSWRWNRGLRTTALELESESENWLSQKNWLVWGNEETQSFNIESNMALTIWGRKRVRQWFWEESDPERKTRQLFKMKKYRAQVTLDEAN